MKAMRSLGWLTCLALFTYAGANAAEQIAVVKDGRINVRGQPSLVGEVITQLQKGEKVVVLEEVTLEKPKTNEPPRWARIQMPANTPVWVFASYIDPGSKTVKVSRLNLRAGPGENFSVVGRLERGTAVSEIRRVEDWMEIETPPGAYAFVAANLLTKTAGEGGLAATTPETSPAVRSAQPASTPPVATREPPAVAPATSPIPSAAAQPPSETPSVVVTPSPARSDAGPSPAPGPIVQQGERATSPAPKSDRSLPLLELADKPAAKSSGSRQQAALLPLREASPSQPAETRQETSVAAAPEDSTAITKAKAEEVPMRRVVRREGLVRSTVSIQAPTYYELLNPENRKTINYLHVENLGLNLKDYRGRRIVVTGEESIDPRWPRTPVIEVEKLELIP